MDTTNADLHQLFAQLGLDNSHTAIEQFIGSHSLAEDVHITQASFWNDAQKAFLKEALEDDAKWSDLIDHLDISLRK